MSIRTGVWGPCARAADPFSFSFHDSIATFRMLEFEHVFD